MTEGRRTIAVVMLCAALIIGGQVMAASASSAIPATSTGVVAQRAGFAYLTGLRTAVAAMLWNRLEVLLHGYYEGRDVGEATYTVPTIALVNMLDPSLEDPYTVGAWVAAKNGKVSDALAIARIGVESNPGSGHLHANYAQILFLFKKDLPAAVQQCDLAVEGEWQNINDQLSDLQLVRVIYKRAGRDRDAEAVAARIREIQRQPVPKSERIH